MKALRTPLASYVLGGVFFSFAGLFYKSMMGLLEPLEIAAWRGLIAFLALSVFRIASRRNPFFLPLSFSKWQLLRPLAITANVICISTGMMNASTADVYLIANATPVYMVLWQALFERRRPSKTEILIISVAGFGLILFFLDSLTATTPLGFFAGLGAGLSLSAHIYAQGKVGKEGSKNGESYAVGSVLLGNLLSFCIAMPLALVIQTKHELLVSNQSIYYLMGLGVIQTAIPWMLWAKSLPFIPPLFAAFMPSLIAVWAPTWTYIFLSEPFPGALTLIGAVIIHATVLTAAIRPDAMGKAD